MALVSGERLYKDILLLFGPLSQHINALLFWVFGTSFTVLIVANLAVLAGITAVMYRVFRLASDRLTATTACLLFLVVFGFSQYSGIGNFNYVAPYTHEATHGILLTTGLVLLLSRYISSRNRLVCIAAGCCFGLALQTRIDVAVAATFTSPSMPFATCGLPSAPGMKHAIAYSPGSAVVAVPLVVFFAYFLSYLPCGHGTRGHGTRIRHRLEQRGEQPILPRRHGNRRHHRQCDEDVHDVRVDRRRSAGRGARRRRCVSIVSAAGAGRRRPWLRTLGWTDAQSGHAALERFRARAALTSGAALMAFGWLLLRARRTGRTIRHRAMWLWSMLSLALLLKIILNTPFPIRLLPRDAVHRASSRLPGVVDTASSASIVRQRCGLSLLALAVLAAVGVYHLLVSEESFYRVKTLAVGRGATRCSRLGARALPRSDRGE